MSADSETVDSKTAICILAVRPSSDAAEPELKKSLDERLFRLTPQPAEDELISDGRYSCYVTRPS